MNVDPETLPPGTDRYWSAVAHHESGHAVASIVLMHQVFGDDPEFPAFESVGINPNANDGDCAGVVKGGWFYSAQGYTSKRKPTFEDDMDRHVQRDAAIREIIACLAGPFAESAFEGFRDPFDMAMDASEVNGGSGDYDDAEKVYGELRFLMPRRPDWGRIEDRTARLVLNNWTAIAALADRLLVKHELDYCEALEIVVPHFDTGKPMPLPEPVRSPQLA